MILVTSLMEYLNLKKMQMVNFGLDIVVNAMYQISMMTLELNRIQDVVNQNYYPKNKMQFGRGAERFVCHCGRFFDWIDGCKWCKEKRMRPLMARKLAERRAKGIPIKSWQKRGRKAYLSRLVNMAFTDPDKYEVALIKLEIKDENKRRANQVRKRVAARKAKPV